MDELRCSIEYRADESRQSPGRIVGTLLSYGEQATDRAEKFEPGSLHWPDGGIVLNEQHNRQARSDRMRFVPEVVGKEVRIDAPLPDTQRGRDAANDGPQRHLPGTKYRVPKSKVGGAFRWYSHDPASQPCPPPRLWIARLTSPPLKFEARPDGGQGYGSNVNTRRTGGGASTSGSTQRL